MMKLLVAFTIGVGALSSMIGLQQAESARTAPTYSRDIAPLFYAKCVTCHRSGQIGGFSLLSYQDARSRIDEIVHAVSSRSMPPWKPEEGFGEFRASRQLAPEEIELIKKWAEAGAPIGNAAEIPAAPNFSEGWQLGTPDLIVKMPQPFVLGRHAGEVFQCFGIAIDLLSDRFVSAFEFRPGNARILHHSILFLDSAGITRRNTQMSSAAGYSCFGSPGFLPSGALGGWSPGTSPTRYPSGIGKLLKKQSILVMQNHYHGLDQQESDQSSVGIYFSDTVSKHTAVTIPILNLNLDIPAGEKNYWIKTVFDTPLDLDLLGIAPHMHYLGEEMKVTATMPNGTVIPLIWIRRWEFQWQGEYYYKQPVHLPKGTRIWMEARYDNSAGNKHNPAAPARRVIWGNESTDEMALCLIEATVQNDEDLPVLRRAIMLQPGASRIASRQ